MIGFSARCWPDPIVLEELALLLPLLVLFDIEEDEEDAAGTEALEEDLEDVE